MGVLFVSVSSNSSNCELHKQLHHASHTFKPFTTNAIKDATLWHVALCMKMSTSPPNFPAGSCSSFPVRASVCFQPVSPCDVRLPPLLSRQPQLPAKIPPPVCIWATWLFHKGYWNNSAPRRKWQSVQKSHSIALGGWYSLEQCERCFIIAWIVQHLIVIPLSYLCHIAA